MLTLSGGSSSTIWYRLLLSPTNVVEQRRQRYPYQNMQPHQVDCALLAAVKSVTLMNDFFEDFRSSNQPCVPRDFLMDLLTLLRSKRIASDG